MSKRVEIKTKDGVKIVGDFYPVPGPDAYAVLLLHMMPADRKSWVAFSEKLQKANIPVLAIDLRGHGESIKKEDGTTLNYQNFSNEDHIASIEDVRAAYRWLKDNNVDSIFLAGASIGANLALQHISENTDIKSGIILSPGINYVGIEALPEAKSLNLDQDIFVVAAEDDKNVSGASKMAKEIYDALASKKKLKIFETGGHGTDILSAHPDFEDTLVEFFKKAT